MDKKTNIKFTILAIFCIIILCIAITPKSVQNDTFYTIAMGEHVVKEGFTNPDGFTWHEDVPYTYPHWLYDVMIYEIYNLRWTCRDICIYNSTCLYTWYYFIYNKCKNS